MLTTGFLCLLAYLVGSIPSGYLLVRATRGIDVRDFGSNNVGAINVFSVAGPRLALITLAADVGKALGIVLLAAATAPSAWAVAATALLVMVGHAYSAWFFILERRFSEGRSVACALGVLLGLVILGVLPWWGVAGPVAVWVTGLLAPRLLTGRWFPISPATMAAVIAIPVIVWAAHPHIAYFGLALAMAALILLRHRNNIRRLFAGAEPALGKRLSPAATADPQTLNPSGT